MQKEHTRIWHMESAPKNTRLQHRNGGVTHIIRILERVQLSTHKDDHRIWQAGGERTFTVASYFKVLTSTGYQNLKFQQKLIW